MPIIALSHEDFKRVGEIKQTVQVMERILVEAPQVLVREPSLAYMDQLQAELDNIVSRVEQEQLERSWGTRFKNWWGRVWR